MNGFHPWFSTADSSIAVTEEDDTEPSVWLPACIAEVEKLATRCKTIAAKVGNNWVKQGAAEVSTVVAEASDLDKAKVVDCCRQMRQFAKAVTAAQTHMEMLEKKIVRRYTRTYGSAMEIEVDSNSDSEASSSHSNSDTAPSVQSEKIVLKIKNFREDNRKQDYYAEIRNSPNLRQGGANVENNKIPKISDDGNADVEDKVSEAFYDSSSTLSNMATNAVPIKREIIDCADFSSNKLSESCGHDDWDPLELLESGPKVTEMDNNDEVKSGTSSSPVLKRKGTGSSKEKGSKLKLQNSDEKKNESARQDLLKDSSDDSDDIVLDVKKTSSPRIKKTSKRSRTVRKDPKLTSECVVALTDLVSLQLHNRIILPQSFN